MVGSFILAVKCASVAIPAGLSPLHQAIVNEDPSLCNYLLQHGADVNQRCVFVQKNLISIFN
jgi:hypothetical protein